MLLLIKAVDKRDTHTMSLFMTPTLIDGYVKQDGTVVAPHVARRPHAPLSQERYRGTYCRYPCCLPLGGRRDCR